MKLHYGAIFILSTLTLCADGTLNIQDEADETPLILNQSSENNSSHLAYSKRYDRSSPPPAQSVPAREFPQRVQIGGNYSYVWIKPKGNHTTKGNLGGVRTIYEYRPQDSVYAALALSWRAGTTHHDATKRSLQDYNGQERLGYTFGKKRIGDNQLTLFTGAGVRFLDERVSVHSAHLRLQYTEFYVPVGFLFENKVNSIFSWGCNFQWMPQVFSVVRLEPLGGAQWGLINRLSNYFVEVPFTFCAYSNRLTVIVSPFFERWHDGRSTAKTTTGLALDLPSNKYVFTGVNVSLGISF